MNPGSDKQTLEKFGNVVSGFVGVLGILGIASAINAAINYHPAPVTSTNPPHVQSTQKGPAVLPAQTTTPDYIPPSTQSNLVPAGATAECLDGTYSTSHNRAQVCLGHGGVAKWL